MAGRGGAGRGQGRKPLVQHYVSREKIGKTALEVGMRCEEYWRKFNPPDELKVRKSDGAIVGMNARRRAYNVTKNIKHNVAKEFGLSERMVKTLWDEYRKMLADMKEDWG